MNDISEKVKAAGVVGAGGAGFPTHVKMEAKAEVFLVNGAECEPMLRNDQQLMAQSPELLVRGLELAMQATGAAEGIIALKAKYTEAIAALQPLLPERMRIAILRDVYPAGDEVIALWMTTGRRVPPGGIPLHVGAVVNNPQTLMNVARAMEGTPVTSRTFTVTGAVQKPLTVTARIGAPLQELLDLAGGPTCDPAAFIDGGPMMGHLIEDLSQPVTKTTGGLIVLPADHMLVRRKRQSMESVLRIAKTVCEQCCYCTELCPRHIIGHELPPHLIIRSVNHNRIGAPSVVRSALTCSECGVCEAYACPVGISPMRVNIALKAEFRAHNIRYEGALNPADPMAENRLIPSSRLVSRLNLGPWYPHHAPLLNEEYVPQKATLLLKQHAGVPATPVVQTGDSVKRGQLVADIPAGALGARIHASIDGIVGRVSKEAIEIQNGRNQS
ncbi:MAG TPA: 4Fe-4S dicluster domain-containing protein [Negativicutes bacterium]|nr:4Fe-4S dicluster domain-containing protein [Negativicutes bacterium]